jgi:hypothetical protein
MAPFYLPGLGAPDNSALGQLGRIGRRTKKWTEAPSRLHCTPYAVRAVMVNRQLRLYDATTFCGQEISSNVRSETTMLDGER